MKVSIYLTFISLLICFSCSSRKGAQETLGDLNKTKWMYQPIPDFPNCIDSIIFNSRSSGYDYSCEQGFGDSIIYEIKNDSLYIQKFGYKSEMEIDQTEILSKFKLIKTNQGLKMVEIKHRYGNNFKIVDPKIFENRIYKMVK